MYIQGFFIIEHAKKRLEFPVLCDRCLRMGIGAESDILPPQDVGGAPPEERDAVAQDDLSGVEQAAPQPDKQTDPAPPTLDGSRPRKNLLTKVLPSDRLTLARQIEVLRAFAAVAESNDNQPVKNEEAGSVIQMAATTIVVTNPFFCDVGLLVRTDNGFQVASETLAFNEAFHGLSPETAPFKLRPAFERQWFMALLTPRLRLAPVDRDQAIKVLGEACKATKEHLSRLSMLVEFLDFVGCVTLEGGQIRLNAAGTTSPKPPEAKRIDLSAGSPNDGDKDLETHTLTLDPKTKKKIVLQCPPIITQAELKRIQQWLSFQLIVQDADQGT